MTLNILHSVLLLIVTLSFIFLFGFCFLQALFPCQDFEERLAVSPLIGIGVILFIAGWLWCSNIPVSYVVYFLPCVFLLLCFIIFMKKTPTLKNQIKIMNKISLGLFSLALLVAAVIQGFSYFVLGPSLYIGFGTWDMWNYTAIAQTIIDVPYSTPLSDGNQNPLLPIFDFLKNSRPGSSVFISVISILFLHTTKEVWGAISLLGPILLTCSLWLISRKLGLRHLYIFVAVIIGTSLPGIAWIHLENTFLGPALSLQFILIWPLLIQRLRKRIDTESVVLTTKFKKRVNNISIELIQINRKSLTTPVIILSNPSYSKNTYLDIHLLNTDFLII